MKLTPYVATACSFALGIVLACDVEHDDDAPRSAAEGGYDEDEDAEVEDDAAESGEGEDDGHDCDDDDAGSESGDVPDGEPNAFAMRYADLPDIDGGESGSDSGGSGDGDPWQDDDALVVTIASAAQTCGDPYAALPCGGNFSIGFILPPDIQAPGTYQLWDEAFGSQTYAGELYPEGDCAWGGGSLDGAVEIEHIDDERVTGRLIDTDAWDFDANVEFDAEICG